MTRLLLSPITSKEKDNTDTSKKIFFSGEEFVNGDENSVRNCKEKKEKPDSEIHMPTNIQSHKKIQNFRKRKTVSKATCSQGLYFCTI